MRGKHVSTKAKRTSPLLGCKINLTRMRKKEIIIENKYKKNSRVFDYKLTLTYQYGFNTAPHFCCLHRTGSYSNAGGIPSIAFNGVYL